MLVDSHCHLDLSPNIERLDEVLAEMAVREVAYALCAAVSLETFPAVLALAEAHPNLFASVGVHPEEADAREASVDELVRLAAHPRVVAIGEAGLDYHWHKDRPEWQRERLRTHVRASRASGKPLIIHTRDAAEDTLRILREEGADQVGGVLHCFTETAEVARAALALNFYISFSGILTFRSAAALKEVAQEVPEDRLLVETDSPYLAPVPHRGHPNEPAYVVHVAEELARLRGVAPEHIASVTTHNFFELFKHAHPVAPL